MTLSNIVAGVLRRMLGVAMPYSAAHREAVANAVPFEPAQGWILVSKGDVSEVKAAISDYDGGSLGTHLAVFRVELHPQTTGTVAVLLPDGFPVYDLTNMASWLDAPPDQTGVYGAVAWLTAPGSGIRYYLEPEVHNPFGDSMIGASAQGQAVRVYLPQSGLSELTSVQPYRDEPDIEISAQPLVMELTLDTDPVFGNQQFVVNNPVDHDGAY